MGSWICLGGLKNDTTAPTTPTISAAAISTSEIDVSLTVASTDTGGLQLYTLERSPNGSSSWTVIASGLSVFPYQDTGLTTSTAYYYRAKATDIAGNVGSYSATSNATTSGSGSSTLAYETSADKYVSSSGSNANPGTSGSPYATIAFALTQISNGQAVGVLSNLTENINWATISSGASGGWRSVVAINAVRTITGTMQGTGANKYLRFKGLYFLTNGSTSDDKQFQNGDATYVKFITCGFDGGPAVAGNYVTVDCGSHQLYENCYGVTSGGRYAFLCFQKTDTLFRLCVVRTDNWGSPADDGNPNGGIQLYSTTNCARINCIAVDGQAQRTNNEWLGMFVNTNNVGSSTAITDYGCIVSDCATSGFTVEGKNGNCDYNGYGNVSVRNDTGFTEQQQAGNTGGSITLTGGEYSGNTSYGLTSWGAETVANTNLNTSGNGTANFHNITAGSGSTTNTLNMSTLLSAMKKIGVPETMWGETGWNVTQTDDLFPFQCEDVIRAAYAAKSTRGFCGGTYTLTSYLKR